MRFFSSSNGTQMLVIKASMSGKRNRQAQPSSTLNAAIVSVGCSCSSMYSQEWQRERDEGSNWTTSEPSTL